MKTAVYILIAHFFCGALLGQEHWKNTPITAGDLVKMLEIDIEKYTVEFDEATYVGIHFESIGQNDKWFLSEPQKKVTLIVYRPKKFTGIGDIIYKLMGETTGHGKTVFGSYDEAKVKFKTGSFKDGLTIIAKESEEADGFVYRLKVITSKKLPESTAAPAPIKYLIP